MFHSIKLYVILSNEIPPRQFHMSIGLTLIVSLHYLSVRCIEYRTTL